MSIKYDPTLARTRWSLNKEMIAEMDIFKSIPSMHCPGICGKLRNTAICCAALPSNRNRGMCKTPVEGCIRLRIDFHPHQKKIEASRSKESLCPGDQSKKVCVVYAHTTQRHCPNTFLRRAIYASPIFQDAMAHLDISVRCCVFISSVASFQN